MIKKTDKKKQTKVKTETKTETLTAMRINRFMATCGLCSRREADRWIADGRVAINDKVIEQQGIKVNPKDVVKVDGKIISKHEEKTYLLYYKPKGFLCSRRDDKKRPLIYEQLRIAANVQSVGRLDMDSEGLLLLTDDGDLAQKLTHPSYKIPRQYRVRITSQLSLESLEKLRNGGIDMGDGDISDAWEIVVNSETKGHSWITVTIYRGRYREVRRTLKALKHEVRRLIRIQFSSMNLDQEIRPGQWRALKAGEVSRLQKAVSQKPKQKV
ncbi:MAG: pseudouridine synthase [Mariprofundaceae bacterium]|nr:pseudouridine synthase [Mariprofundaceae bacterium]